MSPPDTAAILARLDALIARHDARLEDHAAHLARHDATLARLDATIDSMRGAIGRQTQVLEDLASISDRLAVTQASIDTTLKRLLRPGDNGEGAPESLP